MNTLPEIKTRPKAYRDLREQRLPIKTAQNMRHSHKTSPIFQDAYPISILVLFFALHLHFIATKK